MPRRLKAESNLSLLARKRISLGLDQTQLANMIGVKANYISRIENGKLHPKISFFETIAKKLKCKVNELVDEKPIDVSIELCPFTIAPYLVGRRRSDLWSLDQIGLSPFVLLEEIDAVREKATQAVIVVKLLECEPVSIIPNNRMMDSLGTEYRRLIYQWADQAAEFELSAVRYEKARTFFWETVIEGADSETTAIDVGLTIKSARQLKSEVNQFYQGALNSADAIDAAREIVVKIRETWKPSGGVIESRKAKG